MPEGRFGFVFLYVSYSDAFAKGFVYRVVGVYFLYCFILSAFRLAIGTQRGVVVLDYLQHVLVCAISIVDLYSKAP